MLRIEKNPGQTVYFYDANTGTVITSLEPGKISKNFSGSTTGTNSATNIYSGGSYHVITQTINKGGESYSRTTVSDNDGNTDKVTNGVSGNIEGSGGLVFTDDNFNTFHGLENEKFWKSPSTVIPGKAKQTIYYVNAKTGDLIAKTSYDALTGETYDANAAKLETIKHNGKTYKFVSNDKAS